MSLTVERSFVLHGEDIIPTSENECGRLFMSPTKVLQKQQLACSYVFSPSISAAVEQTVNQCETGACFQSHNAAAPLSPNSSITSVASIHHYLLYLTLTTFFEVTSVPR